ncbi:hypothetical protein HY570_02970 [Candidatus Micrarchaeota archaeon]|nr:hypothetical protein [Candidatus Micrarchaeota archaeon]
MIERRRKEVTTRIRESGLLEEARSGLLERIAERYLNGNKKDKVLVHDQVMVNEVRRQNRLERLVRSITLAKALTLDEVSEEEIDDVCERLIQATDRQIELLRIFSFLKFGGKTDTLEDAYSY